MSYNMLINGQLVSGGRTLDIIDPATGAVFAQCACATEAQFEEAVAAAAAAFPAWSRTPIEARSAIVLRIAEVIEENLEELARLLTSEQGKPLQDARAEVGGAAYFMRDHAAARMPVEVREDNETRRVELHRVPLGVVAAITPWNFPLLTGTNKLGAALITGNTVVLKPAATTPLTTLLFGALVKDIIPAGVLNIVTDQNDLGHVLTAHPLIRKVTFTGSTATGTKVMGSSADTLKRLTLELGGNDSAIVLDDCDPDAVASKLFDAAFANNGQLCVAVKRLYVHDSQYDAICDRLADIARGKIVGSGLEQGTQLGPVQNRMQFDKVTALIAETRAEALIIAGGDSPEGPGYFINPTIVRDIADTARLVREEQFGPVLPVLRYQDVDDAIARANASSFGLGNSVWSGDMARAHDVAAQLDSGSVWINQHADISPGIPFSGAKMSGVGTEMSELGLLEFTQVKVINRTKVALV